MTQPTQQPRPVLPPFWPGLLLNLLLPGSGFTLLGCPWLHLAALALTVLDWFAAWLLILYVWYSGLATATAHLPPIAIALTILGVLLFLLPYVLLTWSYVRVCRQPLPALPTWLKWLLILLHLGVLLMLVLPPLLGNPLVL